MPLRDFAVPLALLLIAMLTYLLILGRLTGWQFVGSLTGVGILVGVLVIIVPRSEQVAELGAKASGSGVELLVRMEQIQKDVYAKAESLQRLAEDVGRISAFNLRHLGRFGPDDLDAVLLRERDQLARMLRDAGIAPSRVEEIVAPITEMVLRDLAREVWEGVREPIARRSPPPADMTTIRNNLIEKLVASPVGRAAENVRPYLESFGVWDAAAAAKVSHFDEFRRSGRLPSRP